MMDFTHATDIDFGRLHTEVNYQEVSCALFLLGFILSELRELIKYHERSMVGRRIEQGLQFMQLKAFYSCGTPTEGLGEEPKSGEDKAKVANERWKKIRKTLKNSLDATQHLNAVMEDGLRNATESARGGIMEVAGKGHSINHQILAYFLSGGNILDASVCTVSSIYAPCSQISLLACAIGGVCLYGDCFIPDMRFDGYHPRPRYSSIGNSNTTCETA
jgi:hypothetical protein